MIKIKHLITVFFLGVLSSISVAQVETIPLPPQIATFTGATRGFHFTAPVDFTIISLRVPTNASSGPQSIAVVTFNAGPPPAFPGTTLNYNQLFYVSNDPSTMEIPVNIPITAGQVVGVYGSRGNATNSYGQANWNTTLFGNPILLQRSGLQANLATTWPFPIWSEVNFNIGRVEVTCQIGGGGGGGDEHCVPNDCVVVTCPDDVTVDCIENYEIDVNNATAEFLCSGEPPCYTIGEATGSLTPVLKAVSGVCGPAAVATSICDCPVGYVAVGYEGIAGNPWGSQVLNQFSLRCKELNQDGTLGTTVMVTCSNGTAINNNTAVGPVDAGSNQAMVGGRLRIGCAIDAVAGFSKPISEVGSGDPNSNNTQMAFMGGTGGSLGALQLAPNGNVIVGMQAYEDLNGGSTNNVSGGVAWRYAPIESCGGGGGTGNEAFRYVDQPQATGAPNCPGTVYEIIYHVGDDLGNVGCCVQLVTIENDPPVVSVPAPETVSCYEDIPVITGDVITGDDTNGGDATVTTSCGEAYDLKILPPVVEGVHNCPGTTYTYAYRVRDNCGREVIANRVFTIGNNAPPTIVAPPDMTVSCDFFANLNPDYAEVTTGCDLGYSTTVSEPTTTGSANCPGATYTYTYTVTDDCGRSASDTRKFTIVNDGPTFLNCPDVPLQLNCEDEGWEQVIQAWLASVQAESSCSAALNVTNNYNPNTQGLCINNGTKIVRWFATDACGRTSVCEGKVIIADTEAPVFVSAPQDELVVCNYITQDKLDAWVDAHGYAEVEDCWDNVNWSTFPNNPTINCEGNPGPTSLTVTFVATDGCGNKSSMDATFTALPAMGGNGGSNEDVAAESLQLFQNQPNPFSDQTSISFYLPEGGKATLSIYDVSGKLLKEIRGEYSQGMNVEEINRSDLQGTGMLYYKLSTATETATQRMILLD